MTRSFASGPEAAECSKNERAFPWLILVGVGIPAGLLFYAFFGDLNADEGFYGLAARAVMGGSVPYRDFGFTQTPLLPYINGAVMHLVGFGYIEQRMINVIWALASVGLGVAYLWRCGGRLPVLVFCCLVLSSLGWLSFSSKGKTYALVGLLLMGMTVFGLSRMKPGVRIGGVLACGAVAVCCRLPILPLVGFAVMGLMLESRSWSRALVIAASGALLGLALLLPFALLDWSNFVFWNFEFHMKSLSVRDLTYRLEGFVEVALPVWLLGIASCAVCWRSKRLRDFQTWLVVGLVVTVIINLGSTKGYGEYAVPLVPILALLVARPVAERLPKLPVLSVQLAVLAVVIAVFFFRPDLAATQRRDLGTVVTMLSRIVPEDRPLFGSMPVVALESGHPFPVDLLMGKFVLTEDYSDEEAARRHLITPAQLAQRLRSGEFGAVVLSRSPAWNFSWSVPSYYFLSPEGKRALSVGLEDAFEIGIESDTFVIFLPREHP